MSNVLIIGAGGVGAVAVQKCLQLPEVFSSVSLASRTLSKCEAIQKRVRGDLDVFQLDADEVQQTVELIKKLNPDLVVGLHSPDRG